MICIFDCETIPDIKLAKEQFNIKENDGLSISNTAFSMQEEKTRSSFLPLPFHQVVAISAVMANKYGKFEKVNSIDGKNEKEMISNFLKFIDKHNPKLVSFNGRNFDMPMLLIRAMKYNLSCPAYFDKDDKMHDKTKWDNYRYRYSDRFHVDLMDHIGEFGAARGLKLDTLCAMAGLPGKYDVSGDQVTELFYQNETEKIKEYCESDVLNTYWLYLKYELLKGNLTIEDYCDYLQIMGEKMAEDKSYFKVFKEHVENELSGF